MKCPKCGDKYTFPFDVAQIKKFGACPFCIQANDDARYDAMGRGKDVRADEHERYEREAEREEMRRFA
jgi:hypothetical protein